MSTVSKLDDKDPFALPPGFEEDDRQQTVTACRRSLARWISDAIEYALVVTLHVMAVLALIAFWGLALLVAASFAVQWIGAAT